MPTTLRSLLDDGRFRLRLVSGAEPDTLDTPISWVHNSDLPDPTPWMEPGQLLLTDGAQFTSESTDETVEQYVETLAKKKILALGFATQIVHDSIPDSLVRACARQAMPLIEVADRTPFIAIIRHVADVIAGEQTERLEWSLQAQRALARAALRPDGLAAILQELERQLACWVALFDAVGNPVAVRTKMAMPADIAPAVQKTVRATLEKGMRSGARLSAADGDVTLQTIGQRDRLRGVLAVGTAAPLDPAGNDLVTSVIALASIALEQSRTLDTARMNLRSGLLELLLAGAIDVVGVTARRLWGSLPAEPVRVSVFTEQGHRSVLDELELYADEHGGRLFFARRDDDEVVVVTQDDDSATLQQILDRHHLTAGFSGAGSWSRLAQLVTEARRAGGRASTERPFVRFDDMYGEGMLGLLDRGGAADVATRILGPLRESADAEMLLRTVRVWTDHNCAWDPAAKALGIHRHTLRNRIRVIETLLGLDLDRFGDRMELWTAIQFTDE